MTDFMGVNPNDPLILSIFPLSLADFMGMDGRVIFGLVFPGYL